MPVRLDRQEWGFNTAPPRVMHIDLNSAFAMTEQQANPLLRGKPVAVSNRLSDYGTIIAASYEAKKFDVKCGTRVIDAKRRIPGIVLIETDPDKYKYVHHRFRELMADYAPELEMKSIDEGVADFRTLAGATTDSLLDMAVDIKQRMKAELGVWMTCNIGLAPNSWLAKVAAGLNKPDGLDMITHKNLHSVLAGLRLLDLPGINVRYRARLQLVGITSPLEFLEAREQMLSKAVFRSINGFRWYLRLRGWEVDDVRFSTKTVGRQYVLHKRTAETHELLPVVMNLCASLGRRLRSKGYAARGFNVGVSFVDAPFWHARRMHPGLLYTSDDLYEAARELLLQRPPGRTVRTLHLNCYNLQPARDEQLQLFTTPRERSWSLTDAVDAINERYGHNVVMPASMLGTNPHAGEKIPFGSVRYL